MLEATAKWFIPLPAGTSRRLLDPWTGECERAILLHRTDLFTGPDFRRFQINLRENIEMDDTRQMDRLVAYGARLGRMVLSDRYDRAQGVIIKRVELIS
jgi:hypothetical protein